ncbi:MAG: ADP-ribosylglycohydrolase family protein [Marinilabiliales bacterium]|nr:ADP-ribosylglycohydrolase family protein [Marinilabiliales bacterium]
MKRTIILFMLLVGALVGCQKQDPSVRILKADLLKDKIAGGWAGKIIGVTYGAPTEFHALGKTFEDTIRWKASDVRGALFQDDLYVQLTLMMTMDRFGRDAPAKRFQELFAKSGYMLWHANAQARKNYFDSIFPPRSGAPEFNFHANDIDFQIEADYIGFMSPGMPNKAAALADKTGHIMNYGDGFYGGLFVSALYAEAFFESDVRKIVEKALLSLPAASDYHKMIREVLDLSLQSPADWHPVWERLEKDWGRTHICTAGEAFNIDAKMNGAYIVIGLLYGGGDVMKTLEITTRCGQDSDCNPSNAMAVLGVIKGFSHLPEPMQSAIHAMKDSTFIFTDYTFSKAVENTYGYAAKNILEGGGSLKGDEWQIKKEDPVAVPLEVSFPRMTLLEKVSIFDSRRWQFTGNWKCYRNKDEDSGKESDQAMYAESKGDALSFAFEGTAIALEGNWKQDGGKATLVLDGTPVSTFDTYFYYNKQEQAPITICHLLNLKPGKHLLKLVVTGEKKPEATGSRIYISDALVFKEDSAH